MLIVDKLAYSSPLRFKSPLLKAAFSVGLLLICVCSRSLIICSVIMVMMWGFTLLKAKVELSRYIKLIAIPLVFIIPSGLILLVQISPNAIEALWQVHFLWWNFAVTRDSFSACIYAVLVSCSAVSCLYFLALSTPFLDLLWVLRKIHCPKIMIELALLIYRFVFILLDMASNMMIAKKCRLGNINFKAAINGQSAMLAVMLARALRRSSQLYDAMESRLYDGDIKVLSVTAKASKAEMAAVTTVLTIFTVAAILIIPNCF